MEIAVLIPCYNEEKTIQQVIWDLQKELPTASIYVGDNGSTDHTAVLAKKAGAEVIVEEKKGKGNMIRTMFQKIEAEQYIVLDGDGEQIAKDVHQLIQKQKQEKADMVIGNRRLYGRYDKEKKSYLHSLGNALANKIIQVKYKTNIKDIMSGYRVLSKRFVKNFIGTEQGFAIETEMTVFAIKHNYNIVEVPVQFRKRQKGNRSKLKTWRDGIKIAWAVIKA